MIKSPCTGHCVHKDGLCTGCKRSLHEIGEWSGATDERKKEILAGVSKRINKGCDSNLD